MIKKLQMRTFLATISFLSSFFSPLFFQKAILADDGKPVVIAMPPFCDFTTANLPNIIMSLRDEVVSNLIQNYDCVILSRNNGFALSTEHKLSIFNQLDKNADMAAFYIPGADYALTGYFKIAGIDQDVNLNCTLLMTDLRKNQSEDLKKVEIVHNWHSDFVADVTKNIVQTLNLQPKNKGKIGEKVLSVNETWAVMPVKRLDSVQAMKGEADKSLEMDMELALQKSEKIKQIVDHAQIDKVLKELEIRSFNGATESAAGNIAKLVGADKVILGTVSVNQEGKNELRLDLFLVDAKTTVILDARTAVSHPEKLAETASNLVLEFTGRKYEAPVLENSDPRLRWKEALIYDKILRELLHNGVGEISSISLNYAEIIYLLSHDNEQKMFELAEFLLLYILENSRVPQGDKKSIVEMIDRLLLDVRSTEKTEGVLSIRIRAYSNLPEKYDSAISMAQEFIQAHPNANIKRFYPLLAKCYLNKKDYPKAIEYGEKWEDSPLSKYCLKESYLAIGDAANDARELEVLRAFNVERDEFGNDLLRCLQLTRKLEGATVALEYSKKLSNWTIVRPEIQLEMAKIYLQLGDKKTASMYFANIPDINTVERSWISGKINNYQQFKNKFIEEYEAVKKELGDASIEWKTLADIWEVPEKYKVYIQPMGNPDMKMIKNAIPLVEEFLGCRVEILPLLPLPEDRLCFIESRGQYNADWVLYRLKKNLKAPSDAFTIVAVTDKDLFNGNLRFVYSTHMNFIKIISYQRWFGAGNQDVLTDMLAKNIAMTPVRNVVSLGCNFPQCLLSGDGTAWGCKDKKFALCPKCINELKKVSAEKTFESFQRGYNNTFNSDYDKPGLAEKYKQIVEKTLAEAKGKAPVDIPLLPPVVTGENLKQGMNYRYCEFEPDTCKTLAEMRKSPLKESGVTDNISLSQKKRDDNFRLPDPP